MTKVMLYCAEPVLGVGFRHIMSDFTDFQLIETCPSVDLLKNRAKDLLPNLILVDLTPSITLEVLRELMTISNDVRVVLWLGNASPEFLSQALGIGISGILRKAQSIDVYKRCFHSVVSGEIWLDQELAGKLLSRKQVRLSARQRQLIGLVAQGLKNKEIAYAMGICEGTVKIYMSRLFLKVGAHNRFDLALMGLRNIEAAPTHAMNFGPANPTGGSAPFVIPAFLSTEGISTPA